jgi:hypothetical protein
MSPDAVAPPAVTPPPTAAPPHPAAINYVLGFLLVGVAWGFTTPFIRRAARDHNPPPHPILEHGDVKASALKRRVYGTVFAVVDLLRNPRYAVPLLLNLTGSVWFFLLIGQAGTFSFSPFRPLALCAPFSFSHRVLSRFTRCR